MLRCGICETCITPDLGMEIPGYFEVREASGVRDELYSECVYFENHGTAVMLVVSDIIDLDKKYCDMARTLIAQKTGIPFEAVMLSATHTHTGGPVETWGDYVHENPLYIDFLIRRIADGAVRAVAAAREVTVAFADTTENRLAYYRDYIMPDGSVRTWGGKGAVPYGEVDEQVSVLRIDHIDGSPYGMIVNFACHCDCVGGTAYSADYPGEMRRTLRKLYGACFMPVFVNGFCGNINHADPDGHYADFPDYDRRMGRILAADAIRARELAVDAFADPTVSYLYEELPIDSRVPDEAQIAWAKQILADPDAVHTDRFSANEILQFAAQGKVSIPCPVQVLRIGDAAFYGMPGEIFVEFGKMLKERSPIKHAFPTYLANGCVYYVPIRELFLPDVYEARVGVSNRICPDGGYLMTDKLIEMAQKISG